MPIFAALARLFAVLGRVMYYIVREFFGLLAAIGGAVLVWRAGTEIFAWEVDGGTFVGLALGLMLTALGLFLQFRVQR